MTERDRNRRSVDGDLGISRRDLLRRGAVVGGTVLWVTPVIQSMTRPAFAQETPRGGCFCIKWSPEDGCEDLNGQSSCIETRGDAGGCDQGVGFSSNTNWTATLPAGCTLQEGCSKCGDEGCNCGETSTAPGAGGATIVTFFPCRGTGPQGQDQDISHIELCYCCE